MERIIRVDSPGQLQYAYETQFQRLGEGSYISYLDLAKVKIFGDLVITQLVSVNAKSGNGRILKMQLIFPNILELNKALSGVIYSLERAGDCYYFNMAINYDVYWRKYDC